MQSPAVSILIPTYNGLEDLQRLIPALRAQEVYGDFEILALDSESKDGTAEFLRAQGVTTETIPQAEFSHGSSRNRLAQMASGSWLVFLSQDALPVGRDFITMLIQPLSDTIVAGSWARNVPNPTDDALTVRSLLNSEESSEVGRRVCLEDGQCLADLPPNERVALTRFNNVASAMSRETFTKFPFPDVPFGEDSAWAARVLTAGLHLEYRPMAVVQHAHQYNPRTAYARYRADAEFLREVHGLVVRGSLWSVVRGIAYEVREDWRYLHSHGGRWTDWLRSPALRTGQVLGQWRGSREP